MSRTDVGRERVERHGVVLNEIHHEHNGMLTSTLPRGLSSFFAGAEKALDWVDATTNQEAINNYQWSRTPEGECVPEEHSRRYAFDPSFPRVDAAIALSASHSGRGRSRQAAQRQ